MASEWEKNRRTQKLGLHLAVMIWSKGTIVKALEKIVFLHYDYYCLYMSLCTQPRRNSSSRMNCYHDLRSSRHHHVDVRLKNLSVYSIVDWTRLDIGSPLIMILWPTTPASNDVIIFITMDCGLTPYLEWKGTVIHKAELELWNTWEACTFATA
jgi:hypothetical protein